MPTNLPEFRTLANGVVMQLKSERYATYVRATCSWHVMVPTNHPEPDSIADCFREEPCGAPLVSADEAGWTCAHGHAHITYGYPGSEELAIEDERRAELARF